MNLIGTGKSNLRATLGCLELAEKQIDELRDHFDCEWGTASGGDLDCTTANIMRHLNEAKSEIDDLLRKYKGCAIRPNYPKKRKSVPLSYTINELQKALCC